MLPQPISNIIAGAVVILMMTLIMFGLARQFDPQGVIEQANGADYTNQSYEEKERELADCNMKLRMADEFILDIARPNGLTR